MAYMTLSRQQIIGFIGGVVVIALAGYGAVLVARPADPYAGLVLTREVDVDEATREYFEERMQTTLAAIQAAETAGQTVDPNLFLSASADAYALGDLVTAREMLEKQLEVNPINYVAWNNYAFVLDDMGDLVKAEDAYQKTIEVEHGIQKYYADYADFLLAHFPERRDELKALYEDDLARRGQTVWNMLKLGDWYATEGECTKAIDHYKAASALEPTNQTIKDDLATLKQTCTK